MESSTYIKELTKVFTRMIAETNGINLMDTLELLLKSDSKMTMGQSALVREFSQMLVSYQYEHNDINALLDHPVAQSLFDFFKALPNLLKI